MVVTFYSFKGGVGRSMAMANVGEILAERGYSVILCDWDLEAPGLEHYFAPNREAAAKLKDRPGLMDLLGEYKNLLGGAPPEDGDPSAFKEHNGIWLRRPSSYAYSPLGNPKLRLLSAGKRDGELERRYSDTVQAFNWSEFYQEWAGAAYIDFLREDLEEHDTGAQIVLVDSRTGLTEHGGVSIHQMADLVVLVIAPNDQNLGGAERMIRTLEERERDLRELRSGRPLKAMPVASRVEKLAEEVYLLRFRKRFIETFRPYIDLLQVGDVDAFYKSTEIPHVPALAFSERVVAREAERNLNEAYAAYSGIATAIARFGESSGRLARRGPAARGLLLSFAAEDKDLAARAEAVLSPPGHSPATLTSRPLPDDELDRLFASSVLVLLHGRKAGPVPPDRAIRRALLRAASDPHFRMVNVIEPGVRAGDMPYALRTLETIPFDEAAARLAEDSTSASPGRREPAHEPKSDPPFPGAQPYTQREAAFFFGRDQEAADLLARLKQARILVLTGDAACGRSSLVRAGLIPLLLRDGPWRFITVTPEPRLSPTAANQNRDLIEMAGAFAGQEGCLIIVDQFERADPAQWQPFFQSLAGREGVLLLIITRPEGLDGVAGLERMTLALPDPKASPELVQSPLAIAGLGIEPDLLQSILDDAGSGPGRLARLQSILAAVCEVRSTRVLTRADYERAGGHDSLLFEHARRVYERLGEPRQAIARSILLNLVAPGNWSFDTPRTQRLPALLASARDRFETEAVLFNLIEQRLLLTRFDAQANSVEVDWVHPRLASHWPLLRSWVAHERGDLVTSHRVQEAWQGYLSRGQKLPDLLSGALLDEAREWRKRHPELVDEGLAKYLRISLLNSRLRFLRRAALYVLPFYLILLLVLWLGWEPFVRLGFIQPGVYTSALQEDFPMNPEGRPSPTLWSAPPQWKIVPGHVGDPSNGALLVTGPKAGFLDKLGPNALFDFLLDFGLELRKGNRFSWLVRVPFDRSGGYRFDLERRGDVLYLAGIALSGSVERRLGEPQLIPLLDRFEDGDRLRVLVTIDEFRFRHTFKMEPRNEEDFRASIGVSTTPIDFEDPQKAYRSGVAGFLSQDSEAIVDFVYILPSK